MFIEVSFLPSGRVTHVIVDKNSPPEFLENLKKLKITAIPSTKVAVSECVSTHPDMQIFHIGKNTLVCEPTAFEYYREKLSPLGFEIICGSTVLSGNYPNDIAYNVARVASFAVHKTSHTDSEILSRIKQSECGIIDVAQGYTKCALCIVNKNAVITSDPGLFKPLRERGIEVLMIEKGAVMLGGEERGFIGGTCGLISPEVLAFCGNIEKHPSYKEIKAFAKSHSVDVVSLCSGGLIDIGSVVPIKQEVIDWNNSR
ncbi:MAG: hypothetical protein BWY15_00243 [Firmicutes bacterium ADurb.Bin193]|nr:MAG: hypothetical protein BWY15_00243 [Firmicutes bacterium ADurb.Bin193]